METITFLLCFAIVLREIFAKAETNTVIVVVSLISMTICSIIWEFAPTVRGGRNK